MPLRESVCVSPACDRRGIVDEHYYPRTTSPILSCSACGIVQRALPSRFNVPFLGPMTARYNDRKIAGAHVEGHFVTLKKTLSGKEEVVFVDSWEKQKAVCKQEGLILPSDLPTSPALKAGSGKEFSTCGLPGNWHSRAGEIAPEDVTLSSGRRLTDAEISAMFPTLEMAVTEVT